MFYLLRVVVFMVLGPFVLPFYILWKLFNVPPKTQPRAKTKGRVTTARRE